MNFLVSLIYLYDRYKRWNRFGPSYHVLYSALPMTTTFYPFTLVFLKYVFTLAHLDVYTLYKYYELQCSFLQGCYVVLWNSSRQSWTSYFTFRSLESLDRHKGGVPQEKNSWTLKPEKRSKLMVQEISFSLRAIEKLFASKQTIGF